jgi:hypothetical protein
MIRRLLVSLALFAAIFCPLNLTAQEKKLEKFRTGGGSASAAQMSVWLAKEGNYYEKNGLSVEVISIPGSSLAIQAMLSGEPADHSSRRRGTDSGRALGHGYGDHCHHREEIQLVDLQPAQYQSHRRFAR